MTYLFLELEWSWLNFVVTWLKIFKPNDSTKKLSQMVLSQVTGNLQEPYQTPIAKYRGHCNPASEVLQDFQVSHRVKNTQNESVKGGCK